MAYYDVAVLSEDNNFRLRVAACYAVETADYPIQGRVDPVSWGSDYAWLMAAQPGFGDAYAYAVVNENPEPGRDPAVITDGQILSAVQALMSRLG